MSAAAEARPVRAARGLLADPRLPVALFAFAAVVSAGLLIALSARLTFFIDDWDLLLHRRGFSVDAFFTDHAGHPSMSLVAIYKFLQATFGMDSLTPYAVVSTLAFIASVVLLFIWMRRRVGDWLALAGTLPLLFLGAAYEDLLTPFQLGYFAPMACGIGALLALERADRRGDILCCALLVVAISFQTVGLIFVAAAAVAIAWDRELRARAWVVVVPAALYALWYLGWGDSDANQVSFENVATSPGFILDGYAAAISSLFGLTSMSADAPVSSLDWGRPLLALAIVAGAAAVIARGRIPKWLAVVVVAGLAFWFLTAINASIGRTATTSRYQYIGVVLVLMTVAELARGVRPSWRVIAIAVAVSLAATAANLSAMRDAYHGLKGVVPAVRGDLAALEIAADNVDPGLVLTPKNSDFNYFTLVDAGSYLSAVDKFGSPAYTAEELASAPEPGRAAADKVLAAADGVTLRPVGGAAGCRPVPAAAGEPAIVQLEPGSTWIVRASGGETDLALRRYATESFPVELGSLAAGEAAALELPADGSAESWELAATGAGLEVCESSRTSLR